jgi:hypothetical protein
MLYPRMRETAFDRRLEFEFVTAEVLILKT